MSNSEKLIYRCDLPVRWGDMDAYGHVNNAMYMRYLEEARVQLLDEMGVKLDPEGLSPVVVSIGCTFFRPVVYPDTLKIDCYIDEPGRSSFMTLYKVYSEANPDEPVSEGYAKVVWIDQKKGASVPLPANIKKLFL